MNSAAQKELATVDYWDKRYIAEQSGVKDEDGEDYEWFKTYEKLKPFFARHLPSAAENPGILQLGCGTSTLTADLYDAGYENQVSIDFSSTAIETMKHRYEHLNLDWQIMDVRKMKFEDSTFDLTIDKGTLDAMLHGSLWDPEEDVRENVQSYVNEVARILKPGGRWLYITFRQPHFLKPLLRRDNLWSMQIETLEDAPGTFKYFGFIMTKHAAASSDV